MTFSLLDKAVIQRWHPYSDLLLIVLMIILLAWAYGDV